MFDLFAFRRGNRYQKVRGSWRSEYPIATVTHNHPLSNCGFYRKNEMVLSKTRRKRKEKATFWRLHTSDITATRTWRKVFPLLDDMFHRCIPRTSRFATIWIVNVDFPSSSISLEKASSSLIFPRYDAALDGFSMGTKFHRNFVCLERVYLERELFGRLVCFYCNLLLYCYAFPFTGFHIL